MYNTKQHCLLLLSLFNGKSNGAASLIVIGGHTRGSGSNVVWSLTMYTTVSVIFFEADTFCE